MQAIKSFPFIALVVMSFCSLQSGTAIAGEAATATKGQPEKSQVEPVQIEDQYGTTNPEELSMNYYVKDMDRSLARGHDFVCSIGYFATKSGDHATALKIFRKCAEKGNQGSKMWLSYMHQNGFGVKKDPKASTDWVKESAEDGYSIGKYNYGVALLKGYGVKRNVKAGKQMIDEVAKDGDRHAIELKQSGYNPDVITPDADQADSKPLF